VVHARRQRPGVAAKSYQLHQQLLLLEVDQNLQFLASTSSNAIALTVGAL
jgi:hypothetical protein